MESITDRIDKIADNKNLTIDCLPTMARIEITGKCTLKCKYCFSKELEKHGIRQKLMSIEDFRKCLDFIHSVGSIKEVGLFYMGESSIHPMLEEFYHQLKNESYFTFLTTNGTTIKNTIKAIPFIDSLKLSWNYIDLNDFKEKTGIKEDKMYYRIMENARILYDECHKQNKSFYVSTILDVEDQSMYDNSLNMLKFDQHYWIPLQSQCGYVKIGKDGVIGQSENTVDPIPCWSLFKGLYIDQELYVHTCCYGNQSQHIAFSINDHSRYYLCEKIFKMRALQLENKIPHECRECLSHVKH